MWMVTKRKVMMMMTIKKEMGRLPLYCTGTTTLKEI
jgi:hypothetical protein